MFYTMSIFQKENKNTDKHVLKLNKLNNRFFFRRLKVKCRVKEYRKMVFIACQIYFQKVLRHPSIISFLKSF